MNVNEWITWRRCQSDPIIDGVTKLKMYGEMLFSDENALLED